MAKAKKATKAKKAAKPKAKKAAKPKAKAAAKKPAAPKAPEIKMEEVGVIEHYYGGISVAVVKITKGSLRVGDEILIQRGDGSFRQKIDSMEIEHEKVNEVKPGASFGLKIAQKATEGNKVFKIVG